MAGGGYSPPSPLNPPLLHGLSVYNRRNTLHEVHISSKEPTAEISSYGTEEDF